MSFLQRLTGKTKRIVETAGDTPVVSRQAKSNQDPAYFTITTDGELVKLNTQEVNAVKAVEESARHDLLDHLG